MYPIIIIVRIRAKILDYRTPSSRTPPPIDSPPHPATPKTLVLCGATTHLRTLALPPTSRIAPTHHVRIPIQPRRPHLRQRLQPPGPHRRLRFLRPPQHPHNTCNLKVSTHSHCSFSPTPSTRYSQKTNHPLSPPAEKPPTASPAPRKPPSPPPTTTSSPSNANTPTPPPAPPPPAPPTTPPSPPSSSRCPPVRMSSSAPAGCTSSHPTS